MKNLLILLCFLAFSHSGALEETTAAFAESKSGAIGDSLYWTLEIRTWGMPGSDESLFVLESSGLIRIQKKSLPFTSKGLTTVERKLSLPLVMAADIRAAAEGVIRQIDLISTQSRVADGTNISIRLTVGTVGIGTVILGLEKLEDAGAQINSLIKEINGRLPEKLHVE